MAERVIRATIKTEALIVVRPDQDSIPASSSVLSNAEIAYRLASLAQLSSQKDNPYKVKVSACCYTNPQPFGKPGRDGPRSGGPDPVYGIGVAISERCPGNCHNRNSRKARKLRAGHARRGKHYEPSPARSEAGHACLQEAGNLIRR